MYEKCSLYTLNKSMDCRNVTNISAYIFKIKSQKIISPFPTHTNMDENNTLKYSDQNS